MKSTSATSTCGKLREVFARYGVARVLVSDNRLQFTSYEFRQFIKANSILHLLSTPYHPKANGLAEGTVRTFKERMLAARNKIVDINTRLRKFLLSDRNTPQKSTGRPPAEMMFGHRLRTCLDLVKPVVRAKIDAAKFRQQCDHDDAAQSRSFAEGVPVWVANKTSPSHMQGEVLHRAGPLSYVVLVNGKRVRKHADQLRFRRAANVDRPYDVDTGAETDDSSDLFGTELLLPAQPAEEIQTATPQGISSQEVVMSAPEAVRRRFKRRWRHRTRTWCHRQDLCDSRSVRVVVLLFYIALNDVMILFCQSCNVSLLRV
jgi:hypothetical protein